MSQHRCATCKSMLVDVREPDGTIRRGCPACEPLTLVDIVRQLHEVRR